MSVFECPCDSSEKKKKPTQEDLKIMKICCERKSQSQNGILCRENQELSDEMPSHDLAEYKAIGGSTENSNINETFVKFWHHVLCN